MLPSDPDFLVLSDEQLHWMRNAKRSYIREIFDALGGVLGTRMTSEEFHGNPDAKDTGKKLRDVVSFPLSFLIAADPGLVDKAYRTNLAKPKSGYSGDGTSSNPINMSEVFSPARLRDMFSSLRQEVQDILPDAAQ